MASLLDKANFQYDKWNNCINEIYPSPISSKFVLPKHFHLKNGMRYLQYLSSNNNINDYVGYTYRNGVWYATYSPAYLVNKRLYPSRYSHSDNQDLLDQSGFDFVSVLGWIDSNYPPYSKRAIVPNGFNAKKYDWWCWGDPWSKHKPGIYSYENHKWHCEIAKY